MDPFGVPPTATSSVGTQTQLELTGPDLFSPRSAAAMALSSISSDEQQPRIVTAQKAPPPQEPFYNAWQAAWQTPHHSTTTTRSLTSPSFYHSRPPLPSSALRHTPVATTPVHNSDSNSNNSSHKDGVVDGKSSSSYSRKNKSLSVLAQSFLLQFQTCPPATALSIDGIAIDLKVERRRVYDICNILEALDMVQKKGKNTYQWMGRSNMNMVLSHLQNEGLYRYRSEATALGTVVPMPHDHPELPPPDVKTLSRLSQQFVQIFLIGHVTVSLLQISDFIYGQSSESELLQRGNGAVARGLKTKIRRLYDIANVLLAVGLIEKVCSSSSDNNNKRPHFAWTGMSPIELRHLYLTGQQPQHQQHHPPQQDDVDDDDDPLEPRRVSMGDTEW